MLTACRVMLVAGHFSCRGGMNALDGELTTPPGGVPRTLRDETPDSERVRRCLELDREDPAPACVRDRLKVQRDECCPRCGSVSRLLLFRFRRDNALSEDGFCAGKLPLPSWSCKTASSTPPMRD